jgi:hypothetical protein
MSGKRICLAGLVVVLLGLQVAHGQGYSPDSPLLPQTTPGLEQPNPDGGAGGSGTDVGAGGQGIGGGPGAANGTINATAPISSWLAYPRSPGCCGPLGGNGPIGGEIFLRAGISYPFGGSVLENSLRDGWDIDGGVRSLFFDRELKAAWTVSVGLSNIFSQGQANPPTIILNNVKTGVAIPTGASASTTAAQAAATVQALGLPASVASQLTANVPTTTGVTLVLPVVTASVARYNQTFLNLAGGRVWYLCGCGDCSAQQCSWRLGCEGGGRWGTSKVEFNEIRHLTDTVGGLFSAVYTDIERPWGCAFIHGGVRCEYQYIWGDVLQHQNSSDYQSVILMITAGVRF